MEDQHNMAEGGERALMLTIVTTYCGGTRRVFESRDGAATFRVLVKVRLGYQHCCSICPSGWTIDYHHRLLNYPPTTDSTDNDAIVLPLQQITLLFVSFSVVFLELCRFSLSVFWDTCVIVVITKISSIAFTLVVFKPTDEKRRPRRSSTRHKCPSFPQIGLFLPFLSIHSFYYISSNIPDDYFV